MLGKNTDTLDITGDILEEKDVNVTEDELKKTAEKFLGDILSKFN